MDIFDTTLGTWSVARLLQVRQYFGATWALPNQAIFAGGFSQLGRLGGVDMYDSQTGRWSALQPLHVNRSNLYAANLAGRFALFGSGNIDPAARVVSQLTIHVFELLVFVQCFSFFSNFPSFIIFSLFISFQGV